MNPNVSMVTEVAVADGVAVVDGAAAADGVAAEDGAMTIVGACRPKGTLEWLRLQVSPHHCGSNERTGLMDYR